MRLRAPNLMIGLATEGSCNPYANVADGESVATAVLVDRKSLLSGLRKGRGGYSEQDLEEIARRLHVQLWKLRRQIWSADDIHPLEVTRPQVALRALGFEVESKGSLGQFMDGNGLVDVAGIFDSANQRIQISQNLTKSVSNYTLAHELGHLVCGAPTGLHRDRPRDGGGAARAPEEHEADKFAAFFLMPGKQVVTEFGYRFLAGQFKLSEEVAFAMGFESARSFNRQFPTRREVAYFLSSTKFFNGTHFVSLVEAFGVSTLAMARRLEELEIVPRT